MKHYSRVLLSVFLLAVFSPCFPQNDIEQKAEHAFRHGHYRQALSLFNQFEQIDHPQQAEYIGICHQELNQPDSAIWYFTLSKKNGK
jgi:hypothetical protein